MSQPQSESDKFITPKEVAGALHVTVKTVYRWLYDGDLAGEYRVVGRSKRRIWSIWTSDVEAFSQTNK